MMFFVCFFCLCIIVVVFYAVGKGVACKALTMLPACHSCAKNINNGNRDNHDDKNLEDFINELMRLTKKNLSQVENAVNN